MKLIDLFGAQDALSKLMNAHGMNGAESYGVARLYNTLRGDIDYCVRKYNELVQKYGEACGDGGRYRVVPENMEAFEHDFLDAFEVPLSTRYERAKLRGSLELGLTPREMASLEPFVELDVEEAR
ncbi:MAG: hypothetical protein ACI4QB_08385 [Eubacteriales bacterium]